MNEERNREILVQEENKNEEQRDQLIANLLEMGYESDDFAEFINTDNLPDVNTIVDMIVRRRENEVHFASGSVSCMICQSNLNQVNSVSVPECMDTFCKNCLLEYIKIRIEESQVLSMPCPNHECRAEISEALIKGLVSPVLLEKYLTFRNNEELSKDPFLRWCPKPDCKGYDIGSLKKNQLTCNTCGFNFCYYCGEAWHPKQKCKATVDKDMDKWAKNHGLKYCPNCRRKVEKNLGCDHMTCVKCRYEWCWLCGERYSSGHYEVCEVKKLMKKDPPLHIILKLLLAPVLLPLMCVIICVVGVNKMLAKPWLGTGFKRFLRAKWLSYPGAVIIGLILSPIFFAFAPFIASIAMCIDCYGRWCCHKCSVVISGLLTGMIAAPCLVAVAIIGSVIASLIGFIGIIWKLYVFIRRCRDPFFLLPRKHYGYA